VAQADNSDVAVEGPDTVALWIPLEPLGPPPLPAPLEFVPGPHLHCGRVYSSLYGAHVGDPIPDVQASPEDYDVVSFPCEPSDVVCFQFGTLHGGGATTGAGQRRRTVTLRYFGTDCRLSERSYEPREETAAQWQHGFSSGALLAVVEAEAAAARGSGASGSAPLPRLRRRRPAL